MSGNPPQDKGADLARIRDNQRRSRARRAEHLREIEARLRECEDTGVAASAEMQRAAWRVVRENRRLRAVLAGLGVEVAEEGGGDEGLPSGDALRSGDVRALETLLEAGGRRYWGVAPCGGGEGELVGGGREMRPTVGVAGLGYESGFMNGGGDVTTFVGEPLPPQQVQLPRHPPLQPRRLCPANAIPAPPPRQAQHATPIYDFPAQRPAAPSHHQHEPAAPAPPHQQPLQPRPASSPAPPGPPHTPPPSELPAAQNQAVGTNSCVYATELITAMAGDAFPADVRIDLGCGPQSGAGDCEVDNQVVFELMDRYSGFGR